MAKIRRFVTETGSFKIELLLFSFIVSIHRFITSSKILFLHYIPQLWYVNTMIGVFRIPQNSMKFANKLMDI